MMRSQLQNKLTSEMKRSARQTEQILALSGHPTVARQCPLSGVKRTSYRREAMSASDPTATLVADFYCDAKTLQLNPKTQPVTLLNQRAKSVASSRASHYPAKKRREHDLGRALHDSSERVVSGRCTITSGPGTLQNVGVNDDRDTWTCVWGQTVKATARALCAK